MTERHSSFRDPAGVCSLVNQRILRFLNGEGTATIQSFLQTATARDFCARRNLVQTRPLEAEEVEALRRELNGDLGLLAEGATVFEHERIPFASYPYEWPAEMLWAAGRLTLELAEASVADGFGLKDATPYNILFRGPEPVFVDVPSFERRRPEDPVWNPYGQFVRTFLLPLLAHQRWGLDISSIFLGHRDGLEPEEVYSFCGYLERFRPRILSLVSMPTWLRGKAESKGERLYQAQTVGDPEKARFILTSVLHRLRSSLDRLKPDTEQHSTWSDYMKTHSYTDQAFAAKERFVGECLREFTPKRVLDIGANTGHFSAQAAQSGAEVVALDLDAACVGQIWLRAKEQRLNILPLVMNLSRPSPGIGWRNREYPSFLERAKGSFDGVLMLAVIHHLLVTERIPLEEIVRMAAELTSSLLILEFVAPQDDMFRKITRGRDHLHEGLDSATLEHACSRYFEIIRSEDIPGTKRRMYAMKRKEGVG